MAKKDFSGINTNASKVFKSVEMATTERGHQTEADPAEVEKRRVEMRTQGRKGAKAIRINMAFSPDNHEFIKVMGKATGQTMTNVVNIILDLYRSEHPEVLQQANSFLDLIKSGTFSNFNRGAFLESSKASDPEGQEENA